MMVGVFTVAASAQDHGDPIVGGYGDTSIHDKDVKAAAAFAVKTWGARTNKTFKIVEIKRADAQVVAGMNYRVCMRIRDSKYHRSTVTVVVYKNLQNHLSLSRWKTGGCSDL
jgi:hypothetical protein